MVRQQVRRLAARVVPEPAEVVERALRVVRHEGRGPEPHVPVGRPRAGRRSAGVKPGSDVAVRRHPHAADVADVARADQLDGSAGSGGRTAAACPPARRACGRPPPASIHSPSRTHVRQRLLDVDVLARGAGQHRHERVPVVGRRDDDGVDVGPVEQLAEVLVRRGSVPPRPPRPPRAAPRCSSRDRGDLDVGLRLEVEQVPLADQAVADRARPGRGRWRRAPVPARTRSSRPRPRSS